MAEYNPWMHRYAVFVACATLVLIYVGGLVTSTGSGLAVPDWPLSFGQFFPPMVGGVLYEHGHRLYAATIGLLTIALAVWLSLREPRRWVRRMAWLALLAVVCQGLLGGMTVLLRLPDAVSISHAAVAEIFFCLTVAIALVTSKRWIEESPRLQDAGSPPLRLLAGATTAVIYCQILLGALVRHTESGLAIMDFPLAYGRLIPPFHTHQVAIHFAHRVGALVVTVFVIWLVSATLRRHGAEGVLRRPAIVLALALAVQIYLGAETVWSSRATILTTFHVAGGAFTLATSLFLALSAGRVLQPRRSASAVTAARAGAAAA
jgi:cytochrome c oxidase assembly protein subunit 15